MVRSILLFVALLCAGIGAGGGYTTFFELNPADVTPEHWVLELQHAIKHIGVPLFVVQPIAFVATVASAVLARRGRPSFWFLATASVALLAAALVTGIVHIPINQQLLTWSADAL